MAKSDHKDRVFRIFQRLQATVRSYDPLQLSCGLDQNFDVNNRHADKENKAV